MTTKSDRSRYQGWRSNRAGRDFEALIERSLEWYAATGKARAEKIPEPVKVLSRPDQRGRFWACFTGAAQPDYKGVLLGGRAVAYEAKHTDTDRIEQGRVTPEQWDRLDEYHTLGAVVFVALSFGMADFYRVPWEVWRSMKERYGRKHVKPSDLEQYRVKLFCGRLMLLDGLSDKEGAANEE